MKTKLTALAAAIGLMSPIAAHATEIKVNFTGEIQNLTTFGVDGNPALESELTVGDSVSGYVIYDTSLIATSSTSATESAYSDALTSMMIEVDGRTYTADGGTLRARNDHMAGSSAPLRDTYIFSGSTNVAGPSVGGLSPGLLQFSVNSQTLTAVTDTMLPDVATILALWAINMADGSTNYVAFENGATARFMLTSVTANETPIPAAALLFIPALAGMGLMRKRKIA